MVKTNPEPRGPRPRTHRYHPSSWDQCVQEEVDWLVEKSETATLPVIADPKDTNRVILLLSAKDGAGKTHTAWLPPAAGWAPPLGSRRAVKLQKTRRGTVFAVPADPSLLPAGEDQRGMVHHLRCFLTWNATEDGPVLSITTAGPYHGLRVATNRYHQHLWKKFGQPLAATGTHRHGNGIGALVEVKAKPAGPTFVCEPRISFHRLGQTNQTNINATAEELKAEQELAGLFTVSVEQANGRDLDFELSAPVILGIGSEAELAEPLLKAKRRERLHQLANELPTVQQQIPGLSEEAYRALLNRAFQICTRMVKEGNVLPNWQLAADPAPSADLPTPVVEIVRCPVEGCATDNHLSTAIAAQPRHELRCAGCGALLRPYAREELEALTVKDLQPVLASLDGTFRELAGSIRQKPLLITLIMQKQ